MLIKSLFRSRIEAAKQLLGQAKADAVLAALAGEGRSTLKEQALALEDAVKKQPAAAAKPSAAQPAAPAKPPAPAKSADQVARELCEHYQTLETELERRAFWRKNEKALTAQVSGLVTICMAAAKPLSPRAISGLHFWAAEPLPKEASNIDIKQSPNSRLAALFEPHI